MSELKPEQNISVEIVSGIEGLCLLVNDYRVAGPKPWGGGKVVHSFQAKQSQIDIALRRAQPTNEPKECPAMERVEGGIPYCSDRQTACDGCKPANEPLTLDDLAWIYRNERMAGQQYQHQKERKNEKR